MIRVNHIYCLVADVNDKKETITVKAFKFITGSNPQEPTTEKCLLHLSTKNKEENLSKVKDKIQQKINITENVQLFYQWEGDILPVLSDADLNSCIDYFKECHEQIQNWSDFAKLYIEDTEYITDMSDSNSIELGVTLPELSLSVAKALALSILFDGKQSEEQKLLRFAFTACATYEAVVLTKNTVRCSVCRNIIKMNKDYQLENLGIHINSCHPKNQFQDKSGLLYMAMASYVHEFKQLITSLCHKISGMEILQPLVKELSDLPENTLSLLNNILQNPLSAEVVDGELIVKMQQFTLDCNKLYQNIRETNTMNKTEKFCVRFMEFDEATSMMFFMRTSDALKNTHMFYQETHAFLQEALHGKIVNFTNRYPQLAKFQHSFQFNFGRSSSHLLRGEGGFGQGEHHIQTLREFVATHNLCFMHPDTVSRSSPAPCYNSGPRVPEILTALDICVDVNATSVSIPGIMQCFFIVKSTDGVLLKPTLRYVDKYHCIMGLESPPKLSYHDIENLLQMTDDEIVDYLHTKDLITEAKEFRVESIDAKVSFPAGVYYTSSKGGQDKVKDHDLETKTYIETCKQCLIDEKECAGDVCEMCLYSQKVCDECSQKHYTEWHPWRRPCSSCMESETMCIKMADVGFLSDCAAAQKAYMNTLGKEWQMPQGRLPFTDAPHDLKGLKRFLFWYWLDMNGCLINIRLFSHVREDLNQAVSKPVIEALSRECLKSKDMMSVESCTMLFRPGVKSAIPKKPITTTLIPELRTSWRQNSRGMIEAPSGIIFHPRYSMGFITDKEKNELLMFNMHCPVCVTIICSPKNGLCEPMGLTWTQDFILLCNAGDGTIKMAEITELVSKRRGLLQVENDHQDDSIESEDIMANATGYKTKVITLKLHCLDESRGLVRPVCITATSHESTLQSTTFYVFDAALRAIYKLVNVDISNGCADMSCLYKTNDIILSMTCFGSKLYVGIKDKGILSLDMDSMETAYILQDDHILPLGITFVQGQLVYSDGYNHSIMKHDENRNCVEVLSGSTQGHQDGCTAKYNLPAALCSYKKSIFICEMNNRSVRLLTYLVPFEEIVDVMGAFIGLFHLDKVIPKFAGSFQEGLQILENVHMYMEKVEKDAQERTRKKATQGPDLVIGYATRDSFSILFKSFSNLGIMLDALQSSLSDNIRFYAFTSLAEECFFSDMRALYQTPDLVQYAVRRPQCILDTLVKLYQYWFSYFTRPKLYYPGKPLQGKMEPKYLDAWKDPEEASVVADTEEVRKMRYVAKEFGRGVRQQKVRDRTKHLPGTLPLALSLIPREVQPCDSDPVQSIIGPSDHVRGSRERSQGVNVRLKYRAGEVVAVSHNYRRQRTPFFLAILKADVKVDLSGNYISKRVSLQWLDEEDDKQLVYSVWANGATDDKNSPLCILDRVSAVKDKFEYILDEQEHERIIRIVNCPLETFSSSDSSDSDSDQPEKITSVSKSGRTTTRIVLNKQRHRKK